MRSKHSWDFVCVCVWSSVYVYAVVFHWYLIRMSVRSGVLWPLDGLSHLTVPNPLLLQCRTPYDTICSNIHGLDLLMMGIMMPETWRDRSLIINIGLVASCWFISLHPLIFHVSNCLTFFFRIFLRVYTWLPNTLRTDRHSHFYVHHVLSPHKTTSELSGTVCYVTWRLVR